MSARHPDRVGRVRVLWRCKCGIVRAVDYVSTTRFLYEDRLTGYLKYAERSERERVHADGVTRSDDHDAKCACGRIAQATRVKGTRTEHPCGAKCMASKGPTCECSCGGRNHGRSYLVAS